MLIDRSYFRDTEPEGYFLLAEPIQQETMPHTWRIGRFCNLEGHKPSICSNNWICRLATFEIIKMGEPHKIFSRSVQL